jgi:DNA-binding transcriptional MocR family regulator
MVTGGMPFLLAELSARLVMSGAATDIRKRSIDEINARLAIADRVLAGFDFRSRANVPFFWLALPEPWLSGTFKKAAFAEGVLLDDEDEFRAGRSDQTYHRVRIGISAERDRSEIERGLMVIRRLLDSGRAGYDSFI